MLSDWPARRSNQSILKERNQSWIFIGRTDAEAEAPPDVKNWLIWEDSDAGKDWRLEEKGMTEDEMVGWHHWPNGHEFEQAPGVCSEQGSLVCCSPWVCKELNMTEWLDLTELNWYPKPYVLFSWLVWPEDWLCPMESVQHCAKTEWIKCVVSRLWRKYGKILKAHIKHRPCSLAEKLWQT